MGTITILFTISINELPVSSVRNSICRKPTCVGSETNKITDQFNGFYPINIITQTKHFTRGINKYDKSYLLQINTKSIKQV